jgi:hypothetical protein
MEFGTEDGILGLLGPERTTMDHEGAGHTGLDHEAARVELEHGVFGSARDRFDGGSGEPADQAAPSDAAQHVIVAQGNPADAAANQARPDVSNDGFDFGKLRH